MASPWSQRLSAFWRFDEVLSALALALMMLIPLIEILARPLLGQGIENAPVLVQHLGLLLGCSVPWRPSALVT